MNGEAASLVPRARLFHVVIRTDALYVEECDAPECPWEHQSLDELPSHYRNELLLRSTPDNTETPAP